MILKSLNQDLSRIEPNRQPTVDHILQAINSLCTDIQYHCGEDCDIYGGPVRNYRMLNKSLTRLASMLCDIYDAHSEDIRQEALVSFPNKIRTVAEETEKYERLLQEQEGKRDALTRAENELQQKLRQHQENLEQLQKQENQLLQSNRDLERTNSRIHSIDLPALERTKAALVEQKRLLEEQTAGQQTIIGQLELDLGAEKKACCISEEACSRLTGELETCRQKLTAAKARQRELENTLNTAAADEAAANRRAAELQQNASAAVEKIAQLEQQLLTAQNQLTNKTDRVTELKQDLIVKQDQLHTMEQAIAALNGDIDAAAADTKKLTANRNATQTLLEDRQAHNTALVQQLQAAKDAIAALNRSIDDANQSLAECAARIQSLKSEQPQLAQDLADAQAEEARLSAQAAAVAAKKQTLDDKIAAHNQLLTQLADVDNQIQTANAALAKAQTNLATATQNRDQLQSQISAANTAAAVLQQQSAALTGQLATANAERDQRQTEHDGLSMDLTEINDQITQLQQQSNVLRTELAQGRVAITNAKTDISQLESDIHTVLEERNTLTDRVFTLTDELDFQKQQNESIRTGELHEAEAALADAKVLQRELTVQCNGLKEEQQSLNQKRSQVEADIRRYNSLTKAQKDALAVSTQKMDAARQAYEAKVAELDEINRKIGLIGEELAPIQEKIAEAQALYNSYDVVALKAMYGRTFDDLNKKIAAAKQMQEDLKIKADELERTRHEYDNLLVQKADIEGKFFQVNSDLSALREPGVQEELRKLQANTEVLDHIRTRILIASQSIGVSDSNIPAVLKKDLTKVSSTLKELRSAITDYTSQLEKSISGK